MKILAINQHTLQLIVKWLEEKETVNAINAINEIINHAPEVSSNETLLEKLSISDKKALWHL